MATRLDDPRKPEKRVQDSCISVLASFGIEARRRNVLVRPIEHKGKTRWLRNGKVGEADLTATIPGLGTRIEIEVKAPGERPTPDQYDRMAEVNFDGGIGLWTDDAEWLRRIIPHFLRGAKCKIDREGEPEIFYPDAGIAGRVSWVLSLSEEDWKWLRNSTSVPLTS